MVSKVASIRSIVIVTNNCAIHDVSDNYSAKKTNGWNAQFTIITILSSDCYAVFHINVNLMKLMFPPKYLLITNAEGQE